MRCVTIFEEISSRARLTGWSLSLTTLLLASGAVYAQDATVVDDQALDPQSAETYDSATDDFAAQEASCGCESITGCSDYAAALSDACDSCSTSCFGLGGSRRFLSSRRRPEANLLDYAFGDPSTGSACGGACGGDGGGGQFWNRVAKRQTRSTVGSGGACGGDGGGGQFWNRVAKRQTRSTVAIRGSIAARSSRGNESCAGSRCGRGVLGCRGGPGAGYVGYREPPVYCGMPAPSYPVPYPVPQNVGQTRFTYPPMMPHHSLPHYRHTYSYRHAPGMSRTTVHWRPTTLLNGLAKLHHVIELPR